VNFAQLPLLKRFAWRAAGAAVCIAIAVMLIVRVRDDRAATRAANASTVPSVAVAWVTREDLYREITVPAEFRPYNEVDLHAKVSGYVQRINVDIGDHVKSGELLAVLEVPELEDELHHAIAVQRRTEARREAAVSPISTEQLPRWDREARALRARRYVSVIQFIAGILHQA
jgi:multidrug efflux pump subunit AcrA (membrane-fusion protein)